ncbi:MAG TPA: hypothetical protein PKA88_03805 [Polyangiaceae bacterium]|nr:hypothetical protein [Polyangiaceae bacterium]
MRQHTHSKAAAGGVLRAAAVSFGIAIFVAFVAGGLAAANSMVLTAEYADLCEEGEPHLSVDRGTRSGEKDGITVHCVTKTNDGRIVKRDVGAVALFIGWGVWTGVGLVLLWPVCFAGALVLSRRRRFGP